MTDKKKVQDELIWKRMGLELKFLEELIMAIHTDGEYNAVMDMKTWDRLFRVSNHVDVLRGECENRMAKFVPNWDTDVFYPHECKEVRMLLEKVRQKIEEAAND